MKKESKRRRLFLESLPGDSICALSEAISIIKKTATAKFDESVDISVCLGVDPRKAQQIVRGSVMLPNGTGRVVRVAVFAQGAKAEAAIEAGADIVGLDELAVKVKAGFLDFDVVIATPDAMRVVGQLGQVLGPRGLMPTPKVGTVTQDVALAVREAKFGKIQYKTDRAGILHATVGRASFSTEALQQNVLSFMDAVIKARPPMVKGSYISRVFLSSTMGFSVRIDQADLSCG